MPLCLLSPWVCCKRRQSAAFQPPDALNRTITCTQDPNVQIAREAQAAFGALLDVLQAQQELQRRRGGVDMMMLSPQQHPNADELLVHAAEGLLRLGARPYLIFATKILMM